MLMYAKLAFGNVRKSLRDFGIYFITLVFGVCIFYAFNSLEGQSGLLEITESQEEIMKLLGIVITGVSVFIAIVLGFLMVYANQFLIRRRKREFGIYQVLGMDRSKVTRIIVFETFIVGLAALVVGLAVGVLLSQVLLYVTASLFSAPVKGFQLSFSGAACLLTIICFGIIFLITLIFNIVSVSRYKLITLLNANRTNQAVKVRSLPLCVVLFIVALALIGAAYWILVRSGFSQITMPEFAASTALVIVGTFLFFFSLSGFLLQAVKRNQRIYFSGLNMFTLRQLNSKVNSAFFSISIVCLTLFLAITSTCTGFAMTSAINGNLAKANPYDASLSTFFSSFLGRDGTDPQPDYYAAEADDVNMETALKSRIPNWDHLVADSAQLNQYRTEVTLGTLTQNAGVTLPDYLSNLSDYPLPVIGQSQFNQTMALQGHEGVDLQGSEYLLWSNVEKMQSFFTPVIDAAPSIEVNGTNLSLTTQQDSLCTAAETNSPLPSLYAALVVPDDVLPGQESLYLITLNVRYTAQTDQVEADFKAAIQQAHSAVAAEEGLEDSQVYWPFLILITAQDNADQILGLNAVISYLAIYIGFVLLIACAAILALQQLSEAADNQERYAVLQRLGCEKTMAQRALLAQMGVYFLFPLVLGICHSVVAVSALVDVIGTLGHLDIIKPLIGTATFALVIYGGYFLVTYLMARNIVLSRKANRS